MAALNRLSCPGLTATWNVKTAEEASKRAGGGSFSLAEVTFCTGNAKTGSKIKCWSSMGGATIVTSDGRVYKSGQGGITILY